MELSTDQLQQPPEGERNQRTQIPSRAGRLLLATAAFVAFANLQPQSNAEDDQDVRAVDAYSATELAATESNLDAYSYKFVSSPDFFNADVGDTTKSPHYEKGDPNSINHHYRKAIDVVLSAFKREGVKEVAVAGDTVEGHWGIDPGNTGIFGPTDTKKQQKKAVMNAGELYYGQWVDNFHDYDLEPIVSTGDHEMGDNPWRGTSERARYYDFKQESLTTFKKAFHRHMLMNQGPSYRNSARPKGPAAGTAYATMLHPEFMLLTLDVFKQTQDDVIAKVDTKQLKWAQQQIKMARAAGVDWIAAQYHTPVIGPVRTHGTSGMMYEGGTSSKFWRVMQDVDLILNGEVHAITAHQQESGGPVQVSHGGLFARGGTNYLVVDVNKDKMTLTAKDFVGSRSNVRKFWQVDTHKRMPNWVRYEPNSYVVGTMTLTKAGVILERSGLLDVYDGS